MISLPVQAIAARWGFTDPAHFSRLLPAAYGTPPRWPGLRAGWSQATAVARGLFVGPVGVLVVPGLGAGVIRSGAAGRRTPFTGCTGSCGPLLFPRHSIVRDGRIRLPAGRHVLW
ncbi:hypothetical protein [Streptomyces sp. NPDC058953]|uniref:hypothetical protein n=1 Tax=unclassified Streptomyces TaxID=2593676 RepID=UPI0036AD3B15